MPPDLEEYLKSATFASAEQLADALNLISPYAGIWGVLDTISADDLRYFLPAWIRSSAYADFRIPKKSGGFRRIRAPRKPLKDIQSALNILLQTIFTPSEHAFGFAPGRNVRDNAAIHAGQTCVFNIDLQDFFPSISKQMLISALRRELSDRLTSDEVIRMIAALATVPKDGAGSQEALPQGAPTSPVLSNLVLKSLDTRLASIAEKAAFRYSRYADDITFSHSLPVRRIAPYWHDRIEKAISDCGLTVNEKKTRTLTPGERMEVTGVTVNCRPNTSRVYTKRIRALLHLWEKYGYAQAQAIFSKDFQQGTEKQLKNVVYGKINYLEMIKGKDDPTYLRLRRRYRLLLSRLKP